MTDKRDPTDPVVGASAELIRAHIDERHKYAAAMRTPEESPTVKEDPTERLRTEIVLLRTQLWIGTIILVAWFTMWLLQNWNAP